MASPQLENGYISIATELWEALCKIRINGEARQVLDVIIRKTYGWKKKSDFIALSQFCLSTGLKKYTVCHAITKLVNINIIIVEKDKGKITSYRFNKDFDTWKPLPKKATLLKKATTVAQKGKASLLKKAHTITTNTITTITKESSEQSSQIVKVIKVFESLNPTINYGNTTNRKSALNLISRFGLEDVIRLATYAVSVQGQKYAPTITTPYQLESKLAELRIFNKKESNNKIPSL